jgi:hypothetical protein
METQGTQREVAQLAGARMPADHGLASLGLIMQLFGSLFLGLMAMIAVAPIMAGGAPGAWIIFVIGAMGAVRSALHRMAGTALLYGSPRGPFHGINLYAGVSVAQTAITLLLLNKQGGVPAAMNVMIAVGLLAWPLALVAVTRLPRLQRMASEGIPTSEDMGFEGAAILMILLGTTGALIMLIQLWSVFGLPGQVLSDPRMLLMIATLIMLLVRSVLHVVAGVKGTSGVNSDGASEAAARYYNFGVVSSVIVGAVMLVFFMMLPGGGMHPAIVLYVGLFVYMLLVWPLLLRRFYSERNFGALLSGAEGPSYRRAPDTGLTALGWLLFATGVFGLAMSLPMALFRVDMDLMSMLQSMATMDRGRGGHDLSEALRSPWWAVGISAAQLWAAIELIGMTDRFRVAASVYGVVATLVTLYIYWPMLNSLGGMGGGSPMGGMSPAIGQVALQLVIPACTLILVNRNLRPVAQAHIRDTSSPEQ